MTRETKIGLLVGLAFIIVIGILLSDHINTSTEPPAAAWGAAYGSLVGPTIRRPPAGRVGISGVFMLSVALYAFAFYAAFRVRYRNMALVGAAPVLARIAEGLRLVRGDRRLTGTLVVTMIYNVFGWPFTSMIPVIGQSQLGLGAQGIGVLASMDGIGAFCGALLLTLFLRPAWYARAYIGGVVIYMVMLIVFALVPSPRIAGSALLLTGPGGRGLQHHAGDAGLSCRAARDALAHPWRPVHVHRRRANRIYRARAAGGCDRGTMGDHGVGFGGPGVHGAGPATMAAHLAAARAQGAAHGKRAVAWQHPGRSSPSTSD